MKRSESAASAQNLAANAEPAKMLMAKEFIKCQQAKWASLHLGGQISAPAQVRSLQLWL
jgi:hypothetical protein